MQSTLSAAARRSHRFRRAAPRGRVLAHARTCISQAAKITYLHNAAGQRVFKSEPQTAQTLPSWALLGEYDNGSASGAGRVEYIWLPSDDGSAIPVAMFRGSRYFNIHSDHLGTPRLIKDDSAKPTWQWAYSAFGDNKPTGILKATTNPNAAITNQPTLLQATGAMEFNLRFPGQYLDQETGQFYNYYRTYMPNQGRYTQNDPIGLAGGQNRFGYSRMNAISKADPTGLITWEGTYHNRTLVEGVGAGWVNFVLTSECVDGKKYVANVTGVGSGGGAGIWGLLVGEARGKVTLKDPYPNIRPEALNGGFAWASIGVSVGTFDVSAGRVRVGSAFGNNPEHQSGVDIGLNAIFGTSTLTGGRWENCTCEK